MMENETVSSEITITITENDCCTRNETDLTENKKSEINPEEADSDSTIHGFNLSNTNITVIERSIIDNNVQSKSVSYEGSDSGVEVLEGCTLQRTLSTNSSNSQDFDTARSYESSVISCCSNYEETYNILARRNSTLLEDYKLRGDDVTSEGGSESSSVTGSSASSRNEKRGTTAKKKPTALNGPKNKHLTNPVLQRARARLQSTPKTQSNRDKSANAKNSISKLDLVKKSNSFKAKLVALDIEKDKTKTGTPRTSSSTRIVTTPTSDGRWPSQNSRPAPSMGRSLYLRNSLVDSPRLETKSSALDKYATLPRRREDKSTDNSKEHNDKRSNRESSISRINFLKRQSSTKITPSPKSLPPYPRRKNTPKIKIYHETSIQTALTLEDVEKALSGISFNLVKPIDVEKCDKGTQADQRAKDIEKLHAQLKELSEKHEKLVKDCKDRQRELNDCQERLKEEKIEKEGLKEELKQNTERVLAILGGDSKLPDDENSSSDSLLVLENRYQQVGQVVVEQEHQISELNAYCRSLKRDLEKSLHTQQILLHQQHDLELESQELKDFMQAEKTTLSDDLKEAESEIKKLTLGGLQKDRELEIKTVEYNRLVQLNDQKRQENMRLQAKLCSLEGKIYQQNSISQAGIASLISRLEGLIYELMASYDISDHELEDAVFHNEVYTQSSSSPDEIPESKKSFRDKSPSPHRGSSLVSAIINAIKSAASQTSFSSQKRGSRDLYNDNSDASELLDSETEPCLMMEHVLEDVVLPDGYSHNMVSSGHGLFSSPRIVHSESLNNLPITIFSRQSSEHTSLTESLNASFTSMTGSIEVTSNSLVDQVIEVDNLVIKLLKVLRIIQIENEETMNEVQDDRDALFDQVSRQKEASKVVAKQLEDWETLGKHLRREVAELMEQLCKKNKEIDDLKGDLNQHRKEIQRLNEDVCELSTACSQKERELQIQEDEIEKSIKNWEETGEEPSRDVLSKLVLEQKKMIIQLKQDMAEKETKINELIEEYDASKQVLSGNWEKAVNEAEKQYKAIDKALEILSSIQTVVEQCPVLAQLQTDLETICFQTASSIPLVNSSDFDQTSSIMKPVNKLEIPSPINSTA